MKLRRSRPVPLTLGRNSSSSGNKCVSMPLRDAATAKPGCPNEEAKVLSAAAIPSSLVAATIR